MDGRERISIMSKQWLIDALFTLMETERFEDITVTDISKKADLSRRTFYRSFKNKNELLDYFFKNIISEYLKVLDDKIKEMPVKYDYSNVSFQNVIDIFLEFWWNRRKRAIILINQGLFISLFTKHSKKWANVYKSFEMPWHIDASEDKLNYIADFFIGGYINIISRWLVSKHPMTSKEISQLVYKAIEKM